MALWFFQVGFKFSTWLNKNSTGLPGWKPTACSKTAVKPTGTSREREGSLGQTHQAAVV